MCASESVARLVALTAEQSQQRSLGLGKAHVKIPDQFDTLHQDLIEQIFPTETWWIRAFFLLNTRIFLEALLDSDQLPVVIQIELMNPTNTIGFSGTSIWEIVSSLLWTVRTSVQLNRNPSTSSGANFYWVTQQYCSLAVRQRDSVHLRFSCWIGYSCKAASQRTVIIRNKL